MNTLPSCLLYTQNSELADHVRGLLQLQVNVRHTDSAARLEMLLHQSGAVVLILDINADDCLNQIVTVQKRWSDTLIIVLGTLQADPIREAESLGVYAVEDCQLDRRRFQSLVMRALDHLALRQELRDIGEDRAQQQAAAPSLVSPLQRSERIASPRLFRLLSSAFRRSNSLTALLDDVVESVSNSTMVSRVGVFSQTPGESVYRLHAGLRCLKESYGLSFTERDPFVQWLEMNAHLVSRNTIENIQDLEQRSLMKRSLDAFGAEVVIPLHAHQSVIGWLFVGHRITGLPFDYDDLEELMTVADYISAMLENAMLYDEVAVKKSLLETILESIPTGIAAVDAGGIIRCFNSAAEKLLDLAHADVINRPVHVLAGRLAALLNDALQDRVSDESVNWVHPITNLSISVQHRQLLADSVSLGAVVLMQDLSNERLIRDKQEQLERAALVAELARTMSHEVRNPLVTVKAYAQLLPERFDDSEFRESFTELALKEIDDLLEIIGQIHEIAHPPEIKAKPVSVAVILRKLIDETRKAQSELVLDITSQIQDDLPLIDGDPLALEQCLSHLIMNSRESLADRPHGRIGITLKQFGLRDERDGIIVCIQDNGPGIPEEIRDRIFSPFCTTKDAVLGLGLSIVKRIVVEHNGTISIDTGDFGTAAIITFYRRKAGESVG